MVPVEHMLLGQYSSEKYILNFSVLPVLTFRALDGTY